MRLLLQCVLLTSLYCSIQAQGYLPAPSWTNWSSWSSCTNCVQVRSRKCLGMYCPGGARETKNCCYCTYSKWNNWRAWSKCSASCGDGTQTRTRSCDRSCATNQNCMGESNPSSSTQRRNCKITSCCSSSTWRNWGAWTKCTKTCGGGTQTRSRDCDKSCANNPNCPGQSNPDTSTERRDCNRESCCTTAYWAKWTKWDYSKCPCSRGFRTRKCIVDPTCENPADKRCPGTGNKSKKCPRKYTRQTSNWTQWTSWGSCSKTCGGQKQRSRRCVNKCTGKASTSCPGASTQTMACGGKEVSWTSWSSWSDCSQRCYGQKTRRRQCKDKCSGQVSTGCPGYASQSQSCSKPDDWAQWSKWSACTKPCGSGTQSRSRACESCDSVKQCSGNGVESRSCNSQPCCVLSWGPWTPWSSCTKQGPLCRQSRSRQCRKCSYSASGCPGVSSQSRTCTGTQWSNWAPWTPCNSNCKSARTRRCQDKCGYTSQGCVGDMIDVKTCQSCCSPSWNQWGPWSQCAFYQSSCSQTRSRTCRTCPSKTCTGASTDRRSCSGSTWSPWGGWSSCGSNCQQARTRTCRTKCGSASQACSGMDRQTKSCTSCCAPQWGPWGSFGNCQGCREKGKKYRKRVCKMPDNCPQSYYTCPGSSVMSASCYGTQCGYLPWS